MLYISDVSLDFLGWQAELGSDPVPALTWGALRKVPPVALGVAALMSGVYWMIGRRMHLQELQEERDATKVPLDGTSTPSES